MYIIYNKISRKFFGEYIDQGSNMSLKLNIYLLIGKILFCRYTYTIH